ncbi:MAG: hypothetical protein K9L64_00320 [Candidatus Izimaplasma sp.]|nr:hypothetical protein [Candidatus Izimaplasma bacterium]
MANNNKNAKDEIRTYNPTKSKFGKIVLLILAVGMVLGIVIAAVVSMIQVLTA